MQLCADNLYLYTNNGKLKTYDGTVNIASWDQTQMTVHKKFNAPDITCSTLTVGSKSTFNGPMQVNGNATFTEVINGTALKAKWADLAEFYKADNDYKPGTLVKFGGSAEITIADTKANAVITN
jgi:hypothetical protein